MIVASGCVRSENEGFPSHGPLSPQASKPWATGSSAAGRCPWQRVPRPTGVLVHLAPLQTDELWGRRKHWPWVLYVSLHVNRVQQIVWGRGQLNNQCSWRGSSERTETEGECLVLRSKEAGGTGGSPSIKPKAAWGDDDGPKEETGDAQNRPASRCNEASQTLHAEPLPECQTGWGCLVSQGRW